MWILTPSCSFHLHFLLSLIFHSCFRGSAGHSFWGEVLIIRLLKLSTNLPNLVSLTAELCENQEKLKFQATSKERLFGFGIAKFTIFAERRHGHLPGHGAEAGFVIGTCAFGYVEGVFLKDLK